MSKGKQAARKLMFECGIENPTEFPLEDIVFGRGAILIETPLKNSEGRIVFGGSKALITINSNISYAYKKRFIIAHELGHFEMHRHLAIRPDLDISSEYFKEGVHEREANEFASELLMPEHLFMKECSGKKFSPNLLRSLAERFQTSLTSVAFKYFEEGELPYCLFYSQNNKVLYWKKPEDYPHFVNNRRNLKPPKDSVAAEFFNNQKIYKKEESKQHVWKSTWFELDRDEDDSHFNFYEYCIVTRAYNSVISIVWEE